MFKNERIVPAIVSEELWEKANAMLAVWSLDVKQRQNKCNWPNLMTGKLYCAHCGGIGITKCQKWDAGEGNPSRGISLRLSVYALPLMERSACSMRRLVI